MLTKPEAERIAAAVNGLRPDWSINGILTVLADERLRFKRTYRDTCLAFVALALDPDSAKPTRIFEHGPWWEATRPATSTTDALGSIDFGAHCTECLKPRDHEWHRDSLHIQFHTFSARQDHQPSPRPKETSE